MRSLTTISTLILNPKGGCGKTTIATNLAAYYASTGHETVLMDCDRQGSSLHWHRLRSPDDPPITATTVHDQKASVTRAWQYRMPMGVGRMIIDSPAGVQPYELTEYLGRAHNVVLPILPSTLDMHATMEFIDVLQRTPEMRRHRVRVGVIANRVDDRTIVRRQLLDMLEELNVPLITRLRDTQNYVFVAGLGKGIHEMRHQRFHQDQRDWLPLITWLDNRPHQHVPDPDLLTV